MGQKVKNSIFSDHGHVTHQIIANNKCNNLIANILPQTPLPPTLGGGIRVQNSTCSEYDHVAYQIKGNDACKNMVANIITADPRHWGFVQTVKIQPFKNMVISSLIESRMQHHGSIFCVHSDTPTLSGNGVKRSNLWSPVGKGLTSWLSCM